MTTRREPRDPPRLTETSAAPGELVAAIRAARATRASGSEVLHLAEALRTRLAAAAPAGGGTHLPLHRRGRLPWAGPLTLALALIGGASLWVTKGPTRRAPSASTAHEASTHVVARETHSELVPRAPESVPAPPMISRVTGAPDALAPKPAAMPRVARRPHLQPSAASRSAETELELLELSQTALQHDPLRALSLAQRHLRDYPQGVFAQEREMLAIEALQKLRRKHEAVTRARGFAAAYPESPHLRRIAPLLAAAVLPHE